MSGYSLPSDAMNTSKSLDSIFNEMYKTFEAEGIFDEATAKQAIVEAVEGLAPKKKYFAQLAMGEHEEGYNQAIDDFLRAIKEWQEQGGLVEDSDEK